MITKSFIDLLFILLCATIVMLTQSVQVGTVSTAPAEVDGDQLAEHDKPEMRVVVVGSESLYLDGEPVARAAEIAPQIDPRAMAVVMPRDDGLSHHRVMAVWSDLRELGVDAQLGAVQEDEPGAGDRPPPTANP